MSMLKKALTKQISETTYTTSRPLPEDRPEPVPPEEVRLAVCVPTKDLLHSVFSHNLHSLLQYNWQKGIETKVFYNMGTLVCNQRENLVAAARSWAATHILWLDSDMSFPFYTAYKLLAHKLPIVAANYVRRQHPYKTVAYTKLYDWESALTHTQEDPLLKELIEVEGIGMGCMLTDIRVFDQEPSPWFEIKWDKETNDYLGEDFNFCTKARKYGYRILVDDVLSRQVQHLGEFAFNHDLVKKK